MSNIKIYQIFYSENTRATLDKGFTPLDNSDGDTEWMEYWPIRQYFLSHPVEQDDLIGFFSPRFSEKTGLNAIDITTHIKSNPGKSVYLFNPYFHLAAWHKNIFLQATNTHEDIDIVFNQILKLLNLEIDINNLIMSSTDTVYCNYFVANMSFWRQWLMISEFIYQISEIGNTPLSETLNGATNYTEGNYR